MYTVIKPTFPSDRLCRMRHKIISYYLFSIKLKLHGDLASNLTRTSRAKFLLKCAYTCTRRCTIDLASNYFPLHPIGNRNSTVILYLCRILLSKSLLWKISQNQLPFISRQSILIISIILKENKLVQTAYNLVAKFAASNQNLNVKTLLIHSYNISFVREVKILKSIPSHVPLELNSYPESHLSHL